MSQTPDSGLQEPDVQTFMNPLANQQDEKALDVTARLQSMYMYQLKSDI